MVMGSGIKAYCACGAMHSGIDALRQLVSEYGIKAVDVAEITFGTNRRAIHHVEAKPTDITSAQFSAAFGLALTLIRGGNGFKDYTEETLRDPKILALADKVKLEVDKEVDRDFPGTRAARVTVKLKGGATHSAKVDHCKGTPQNPLTRAEFEEKFRGLASLVADKNRMDEIIKIVNGLDTQKDLSALVALMA